MKPLATALLFLCLILPLGGCAVAPAPLLSAVAPENAHCGEFPHDYQNIIRYSPKLTILSPEKCLFFFSAEPRKMALELPGGYIYGWGGELEIGLVDQYDNYVGKYPFTYLIRNGELVHVHALNAWW